MQPLKLGKDNYYAISQYNNIQNQRWYLVSYHNIDIILIYCPAPVLNKHYVLHSKVKCKLTQVWWCHTAYASSKSYGLLSMQLSIPVNWQMPGKTTHDEILYACKMLLTLSLWWPDVCYFASKTNISRELMCSVADHKLLTFQIIKCQLCISTEVWTPWAYKISLMFWIRYWDKTKPNPQHVVVFILI